VHAGIAGMKNEHKSYSTMDMSMSKTKLYTVDTVKDLSPFAHSLLSMEPRFRLYDMIGDFVEDRGYIPTKSALYLPYGFPGIEHEIAHMVEMSYGNRLVKLDWGFQDIKTYSKAMRGGANHKGTFQALAREARVRGIQDIMDGVHANRGVSDNHFNMVKYNPVWKDAVVKALPFGKFKSIEEVIDWWDHIYVNAYVNWNLDRIRHEWVIRLDYIRNWMETTLHQQDSIAV